MPLSALDNRPALLVVDLQHGLRTLPTVEPFDEVVGRAAFLATEFRDAGLPVVLISTVAAPPGRTDVDLAIIDPPPGFADLLPELSPVDGDIRIVKCGWSAFQQTALADELTSRGVTQTVVIGVATSLGVESTARDAFERGFHVVIARDAVTDINIQAHHASLEVTLPALAEVDTTQTIATALRRPR